MCELYKEDLVHFLFLCPCLNHFRQISYKQLEEDQNVYGHEEVWYRFCGSSPLGKLCLFLGDHGYFYGEEVGNLFDKVSKEFLVKAWSFRQESYEDQPQPTGVYL